MGKNEEVEEKKIEPAEPADKMHVAFGKNTTSSRMHGGIPKAPKPGKQLTTSNLNTLNRINSKKPSSVVGRRPTDPEVVPYPGDIENRENLQNNAGSGTPRHKDFGKVPKYL